VGGFLRDVDKPTAPFSGLPRARRAPDPQQRLLLEVGWEALEDAGHPAGRLAGTAAGVFVGIWINDYEARMFRDPGRIDFYMTTGTGRYTASGRLSHVLGLEGPSITLDTACSSSLVAVHLAPTCERGKVRWRYRRRECDPRAQHQHRVLAVGMMALDGRCKFGDARASGYVRSEGAALVVLKPLDRAIATATASTRHPWQHREQ
jgi:myxalamid-type polyketide synthase MxaE and MxaD